LAERAIINVFEYLPDLLNDLNNVELRRIIHVTADMAGIAFSNSGLGIAHAIGHVIGGRYGIHHGRAVSTVLPYVVKYNYTCEEIAERYEWISRLLVEKGLAEKMPFYKQLYEFIKGIGGDTSYNKTIGSRYIDELDEYIHLIFQDPDMIYNPIVPEEDDIRRILDDMYHERV
jgi:alcohol dehydrogenase class IV